MGFIRLSCNGVMLAGYWSVVPSFFQANMWHFTEPRTTGFSIFPVIIVILCILLPTLFVVLPSKCVKKFIIFEKVSPMLRMIPLLLLLISSLPVADAYVRTSSLAAAIILLQCYAFCPRKNISIQMPKVKNKTRLMTNGRDEIDSSDNNNRAIGSHDIPMNIYQIYSEHDFSCFLLGMLIVLSVRWAALSVNVFYENWTANLVIVIASLIHEIWNISVAFHVGDLVKGMTNRTKTPEQRPRTENKNNTRNKNQQLPLSDQSAQIWLYALIISFGMTSLVQLCTWVVASPAFLCRWCRLSLYPHGVIIPATFLFGVLAAAFNRKCEKDFGTNDMVSLQNFNITLFGYLYCQYFN